MSDTTTSGFYCPVHGYLDGKVNCPYEHRGGGRPVSMNAEKGEIWVVEYSFDDGRIWYQCNPLRAFTTKARAANLAVNKHNQYPNTMYRAVRYLREVNQ